MTGAPRPLELGFLSNLIDRAGAEREPDAHILYAGDPATLHILIAGEFAVLRNRQGGGATAFVTQPDMPADAIGERIYLGRLGGMPVVGGALDPARLDPLRSDPGWTIADLRSIATHGIVPPGETGALAQAKSLLLWHARHPFCAQCGAATVSGPAGLRRDCPRCGAQHFPRTDPVTIMLVSRGDHCLLGRQARFAPGSYSCLAGFVSPGETIEDAVRRETREEAGITVGRVRYMFSQPWPFPSSLMIGCLGEALDEAVTVDRDELEDARWFARDEVVRMLDRVHPDGLVTPPPMAIAHHLIRAWAEGAAS